QRLVAVAQLGDSLASDLGTGLQLTDGDLDQRRAGVGGQQMRLTLDVERREGLHRRAGFQRTMSTVENLDAGAAIGFLEWERDGPQGRGEVLVGYPGDVKFAVGIAQGGDGLLASLLVGIGQLNL